MSHQGLRIIFMGTPDFAVPALDMLIGSRHEVVTVVSQPDRKKGRGKKLTAPPVKELALRHNISILQPTKIKTQEFYNTLSALRPDLIVVIAYGRILPAPILALPPLGCINVHGSLLPRHRGAAPIQWAVLEGDKETGVTIMQMDEGMDTGDILLPAAIPIEDADTAGSLFDKLSILGAKTLSQALDLLQDGRLTPQRQNHGQATKAPPLSKEQGLIDWNQAAEKIHCQIRGLDPWPSAYTFLENTRYRLFAPEVVYKRTESCPGTVLTAGPDCLLIATGRDCLAIHEIQVEGKKRMSVDALLCGHPISPGCCFAAQENP